MDKTRFYHCFNSKLQCCSSIHSNLAYYNDVGLCAQKVWFEERDDEDN